MTIPTASRFKLFLALPSVLFGVNALAGCSSDTGSGTSVPPGTGGSATMAGAGGAGIAGGGLMGGSGGGASGSATTGGATTGGSATGGSMTGGGAMGGAATGGSTTGGMSTGGSTKGGTGGSGGMAGASAGGVAGAGGMSGASGSAGTGATGGGNWNEGTELKAFPTAEGYGRYAKGGRGGRVIEVTTLADSGPGSLRDAIAQTGARTIVFSIGGVIELQSKLIIRKENNLLTVAAQTAPGKGIVVKGWTFGMLGGEDVVMRFVRTRVGSYSGVTMDGMGITSSNNCIYDHCSVSWTIDEAFSSRGSLNFTLQRTMISEALNDANHEIQMSPHGYAASIGGDIGSFHHNLTAHCAGRNWSLAGGLIHGTLTYAGRLDIRNNVFYNWQNRTTDGGAHEVNFVSNYYKPGPASEIFTALNPTNDGFEGTQRYYMAGNVMPGHFDAAHQEDGRDPNGQPFPYEPFVNAQFFEPYVVTQTAEQAYADVLADVGANVPMLDDHDKRIIDETRAGTARYRGSKTGLPGLPDNQEDVGGLEAYPTVTRAASYDSDHDGMPDEWERAHGLSPSNAADGNGTNLSRIGYTNLEMYLNELAGDFR